MLIELPPFQVYHFILIHFAVFSFINQPSKSIWQIFLEFFFSQLNVAVLRRNQQSIKNFILLDAGGQAINDILNHSDFDGQTYQNTFFSKSQVKRMIGKVRQKTYHIPPRKVREIQRSACTSISRYNLVRSLTAMTFEIFLSYVVGMQVMMSRCVA